MMNPNKRTWKLLAVVAFLIAWVAIFRLLPISSNLETDDNAILGGFIEWFGALFGIILALVLVQVWAKHSQVNEEIDKEADALALLLKTCRLLPEPALKERVALGVQIYAQEVKASGLKFKQGSKTGEAYREETETSAALDRLHQAVGEILVHSQYAQGMGSEMLRLINEVIDTRGDRLSHLNDKVPKPLWYMIVGISCVWLIAFFALHISNDLLAMFITGGALFTVSALLFVINDIDNHVGGFWYANFDSFDVPLAEAERLLKEIQEQKSVRSGAPHKLSVSRNRRRAA